MSSLTGSAVAPLVAGTLPVLPAHLGPLHPIEQGLTVALAFGPFVVLALVVMWRRRHDVDDEVGEVDERAPGADPHRAAGPESDLERGAAAPGQLER